MTSQVAMGISGTSLAAVFTHQEAESVDSNVSGRGGIHLDLGVPPRLKALAGGRRDNVQVPPVGRLIRHRIQRQTGLTRCWKGGVDRFKLRKQVNKGTFNK